MAGVGAYTGISRRDSCGKGRITDNTGPSTVANGLQLATEPFHQFMVDNLRDEDLTFFQTLGRLSPSPDAASVPWRALVPAFLVGENFEVIKRYNNSDVFALAVSHLADRARGLGPFRAAWPLSDRQLSRGERIALQKRMKELGHPVNDFEGRIDFGKYEGLEPLYTEYNVGHFARSFTLSGKIDQQQISADLSDGVLTLTLKKSKEAVPRRIAIN